MTSLFHLDIQSIICLAIFIELSIQTPPFSHRQQNRNAGQSQQANQIYNIHCFSSINTSHARELFLFIELYHY